MSLLMRTSSRVDADSRILKLNGQRVPILAIGCWCAIAIAAKRTLLMHLSATTRHLMCTRIKPSCVRATRLTFIHGLKKNFPKKIFGKPRDARKIFVIGFDFVEILGENGIEMQGKWCQILDFRV